MLEVPSTATESVVLKRVALEFGERAKLMYNTIAVVY